MSCKLKRQKSFICCTRYGGSTEYSVYIYRPLDSLLSLENTTWYRRVIRICLLPGDLGQPVSPRHPAQRYRTMPRFKKGGKASAAAPPPNPHPRKHRKMHTFSKLSTATQGPHGPPGHSAANKDRKKPHPQQRRPIVPFGRKDRILMVGEGDFSFARSLILQHRCRHVMATCYDSREALYSKYPKAEHNIYDILEPPHKTTNSDVLDIKSQLSEGQNSKCDVGKHDDAHDSYENQTQHRGPKVLYSVDARKLGLLAGGGKEVRIGFPRRERKRPAWQEAKDDAPSSVPKGGPWDVVCFNFPHVGGLSTDVNRQVRANQELLVAFFKACVPLLSHAPKSTAGEYEDDWSDWEDSESESDDDDQTDEGNRNPLRSANTTGRATCQHRVEAGQILVTMFEGEPYTLWNIKDLARHAGLRVVTSFRFPWACYNEYSHARTLGDIEGRNGGKGGWRGEDRDARMFVFEVKQEDHPGPRRDAIVHKPQPNARKKRLRDASDSDDSE
ncbi:hypothetical protein BO70DRAFT_382296 [Aspergillus heteromorphus CBS 117.55]|uniref:25S rRNA (uridine-N(3))-methyltransferase BMT5-like domain-containing protein n=1 Tax=Aspergillus heteromorphus CBS 117.55 TaxID=1448321 RepID=A0A317VAZ5_9EURO|nr:uncharacterized protein BO70DRAFT_382296 [Aspergillus heteromorphus CBS 117.55]PWY70158.1 hypothetical protein BO70DRAFT_382296 [Aspergillus heteromorphus CBS 117.55]